MRELPDQIAVTSRLCISFVITSIITLGNFPNVIPQSQTVTIGTLAPAFTMVFPTLLFSIGAGIFPGLVMGSCLGLVITTGLLALATEGIKIYIVVYFFVALLLAGLRFTPAGASSPVLLMLISLNTMTFAKSAEELGMPFVASLWTEAGVTNPNAIFRNTLIGMLWATVCICSARVLPPARTARDAHSRKLLPKILRDNAEFIRRIIEYHISYDVEDKSDSDEDGNVINSVADETNNTDSGDEKKRNMDNLIQAIITDGSITVTGGVSKLTIYEPRLNRIFCHCAAPVDLVKLLSDLTYAINQMMFSSLTLRAFSKAGAKELQIGGLKDLYLNSADMLERCAVALETLTKTEDSTPLASMDPDCNPNLPFDPIRLKHRVVKVEEKTNAYLNEMGPIDHTRKHFDSSARKVILSSIMPWLMGGGLGLVLAICSCFVTAFNPMTWKRILIRPYYDLPKFIWALKFAVGFTALVCMQLYWPAFANLELKTQDEILGPHFSGWYLIAYAFSTTSTVEGTWKKGTLRLLGTCGGGFCGWLAIKACGDDNAIGLGAWWTITNTFIAICSLPAGFWSRFGLESDYAWGPAYFVMTSGLVMLDVYWGLGGVNDITANRIASNCVGIAMALFMATIPPGIYGNCPDNLKHLLEDKKRFFRDCLQLMLDNVDSGKDTIQKLNNLHAAARETFIDGYKEANDNFNDAKILHNLFILKPSEEMKQSLDTFAILGSSVLSVIRFAIVLLENSAGEERFAEGSEARQALQTILDALDIEQDTSNISSYYLHLKAAEKKNHKRPVMLTECQNIMKPGRRVVPAHVTFVHICEFLVYYIMHREIKLEEIKWGFLQQRQSKKGRRTTLKEPLMTTFSFNRGSAN